MITLKTLNKASKQRVFNQVVKHLLTQKKKSLDRKRNQVMGNNCVYLSPNGLKCAAECLISKREYSKTFEGDNWLTVARKTAAINHADFIDSLQNIHDEFPPRRWTSKLRMIAKRENLKFNPPQEKRE